jgi:predicted double-glycine peptidase
MGDLPCDSKRAWSLAFLSVAALLSACDSGLPISERPISYQELRFANVVRQRFDFTCGAAALATLLNYFYSEHFTEAAFLDMLRSRYTPEQWRAKANTGLSLGDLRFLATKVGYESAGAEVGLAGLTRLHGPVIVHLHRDTSDHFSVLRGISGDRVFLADSINGNERMRVEEFMQIYTGAVLAVWKEGEQPPLQYALKVDPDFKPLETETARRALYAPGIIDRRKPF